MTLSTRLARQYDGIRADCALVTAADANYAPFLFNALASIHAVFPDHPPVYVYDLGLSAAQRRELSAVSWVRLRAIEHFVPHWKAGWSWKPYILNQVSERYVLYFDAANIVLYRSIALWFLAIRRHGFFGIGNGQQLADITPSDYWQHFGLDAAGAGPLPTFGAGLFGFDQAGPAGAALRESLALTVQGWNLGRSAGEKNPLYGAVVRDCVCFRADQTLLNLAFVKHLGPQLLIRDELRYCGRGGPADHPNQYLWYARRQRASMRYFWRPLQQVSAAFLYNRITAGAKLALRWRAAAFARWLRTVLMRYNAR